MTDAWEAKVYEAARWRTLMAISKAYRRGYKRAIQDAAEYAFQRKIICEDAADRYAKHPDDRYMASSERCAAREAGYIGQVILGLNPRQER